MTSTVVLYLANKLASQYKSGNSTIISLLDKNQLVFLPVLNTPAYSYMEKNFNGTFFPIKTGLEGNSDCEGIDVGINPDRNFPYYWENSTLPCQNDYPGSYPLQSNISKHLRDYLNISRPQILFSFNEEGNLFYAPNLLASTYVRMPSRNFYDKIFSYFYYAGYKFGYKYYWWGIVSPCGTFIDYAHDFYTLSLQLQLNSTLIKSEIFAYANVYYNLLVNTILEANLNISFVYKGVTENLCNDEDKRVMGGCYSWVKFLFDFENYNAIWFDYNFTFIPNFDISSNYRFVYDETLEYGNEVRKKNYYSNYKSKQGYNYIKWKGFADMYTHTTIQLFYVKLNYTDKDFKGTAYLSSSIGRYYTTPKKISIGSELEQKSNENIDSDDDKPNIMIIALTSSLGLLLLLFLAGLWLYCKKKHKKPEKNISTDHNLVAGENPRI